MKKLLLAVVVSLFACNLQAQTSKGTIAVTGTLGFFQTRDFADSAQGGKALTTSTYDYTIAPAVGYFVKDNLALGVSGSFYVRMSENNNQTQGNFHVSTVESIEKSYRVHARQYRYLTAKLAAHATLSAGWSSFSDERDFTYSHTPGINATQQSDTKRTAFTAALSPGLTFFASDKLGLNANFGALAFERSKAAATSVSTENNIQTYRDVWSDTYNTTRLNFSSMHVNIGMTYFIGRK